MQLEADHSLLINIPPQIDSLPSRNRGSTGQAPRACQGASENTRSICRDNDRGYIWRRKARVKKVQLRVHAHLHTFIRSRVEKLFLVCYRRPRSFCIPKPMADDGNKL